MANWLFERCARKERICSQTAQQMTSTNTPIKRPMIDSNGRCSAKATYGPRNQRISDSSTTPMSARNHFCLNSDNMLLKSCALDDFNAAVASPVLRQIRRCIARFIRTATDCLETAGAIHGAAEQRYHRERAGSG